MRSDRSSLVSLCRAVVCMPRGGLGRRAVFSVRHCLSLQQLNAQRAEIKSIQSKQRVEFKIAKVAAATHASFTCCCLHCSASTRCQPVVAHAFRSLCACTGCANTGERASCWNV